MASALAPVRPAGRSHRLWLAAALGAYLVLALAMALQRPGMQYDEALFNHGAIHLLSGSGSPPFAHSPAAWPELAGRRWPLMILPYVGALRFYLMAPVFALFGVELLATRLLSILLAAIGLAGIAHLTRFASGPVTAVAATFWLALHPSYLALTVFDNSGFSVWMACLALVALATTRYLRDPRLATALLLGFAAGLACWARLNFVWLLAGAAAGALVATGRRALPPWRHLLALAGGGLLGALPLVTYEIATRFETLRFMRDAAVAGSLSSLAPRRFSILVETLVLEPAHRTLWAGAPTQAFELRLVLAATVVGVAAALFVRSRQSPRERSWVIATAVALAVLLAFLFTSRLNVGGHHLVTLLPLLAFLVAAGGRALAERSRALRLTVVASAALWGASMLATDVSAIRALRATGGSGFWSDALVPLAAAVEESASGRTLEALDWGFANNLYFVTAARVAPREIFWGASRERLASGESWAAVVARGGLFVSGADHSLTGPFAAATAGFKAALASTGAAHRVRRFHDRGGALYAELFEVAPVPPAAPANHPPGSP